MPSAMSESAHTSHPTFHNDTHTTFPSSATTATDVPGSPPRKLRVAVVGSGLAGLTVAHLLSSLHAENGQGEQGIEVELFEKAHKLGMDAASLSVTCPCQKCAQESGRGQGDPDHEHVEGRMDVPMRSFFPEYYPNLVRLYRSIGVKFHDADNTLSCFDVTFGSPSASSSPTNKPMDVNIEDPYLSSRSYKVSSDHTITLPDLPPLSLLNPYPFGRRLLGYYRIARDYVKMLAVSKEFMTQGRMMEIGKPASEWGNGRQVSLREFLVSGGYSNDFSAFFVPLFACVCTCSFERMMDYPACVVLEYVARCMPFGRMQFVTSGVQEVTENLSKNIGTIHYNTMVEKIIESKEAEGYPIVLVDSFGVRREYDHVVFATQANQAAATLAGQMSSTKLLPKPFVTSRDKDYDASNFGRMEDHDQTDPVTPRNPVLDTVGDSHPFFQQIKTLAKFPYERTQVVCHTDTSFLPKDPGAWRLLNIAKAVHADILASPHMSDDEPEEEDGILLAGSGSDKEERPGLVNRKHKRSVRATSPSVASSASSRRNSSSSDRSSIFSSSSYTTASQSHNSAMATHIMNNTASSLGSTTKFLQTTNPIFQPRPDTVISSAWFERAVVNPESMKAVDELNELMDQQAERVLSSSSSSSSPSEGKAQMSDRVWFVGSYAYPGIPLLEGCVVSAVQVMERIMSSERGHALAPSTRASQGSFLKRDEPMRERRRRREEEISGGGDKDEEDNSASAQYFRTSWKDTLEDERIWQEQEKIQAVKLGGSLEVNNKTSSVGAWGNVYVEVAWMLLLYLAAIVQWWMVFVIESVGFDGSRWAMA
ncbi:hypothetical protein BGZ74_004396 [Mortierella antarctica]|nr:hypothetical protein BGZ74_004396 [Mortierella antarctica]